jgi:hypothetical protein
MPSWGTRTHASSLSRCAAALVAEGKGGKGQPGCPPARLHGGRQQVLTMNLLLLPLPPTGLLPCWLSAAAAAAAVQGVSESTHFAPHVRYEIGAFGWYHIDHLPATYDESKQVDGWLGWLPRLHLQLTAAVRTGCRGACARECLAEMRPLALLAPAQLTVG